MAKAITEEEMRNDVHNLDEFAFQPPKQRETRIMV